jgi:aspartate aminotransferase-like enzyme
MVGSVSNFFSPNDKVLVINGGKFGERWTKICRSYGLQVQEIEVEWGYAVKPDLIETSLKKDPEIKGILVQASETSTGVYHDIKAISEVVKKRDNTILIVDAISALVAHDIKTDQWGIDVMVGGSQKGVMLPPGLSFVSISEKAWKMAEKAKLPKFYFHFKKEKEALAKNQTNFTSAVTLIIGLNESIKLLQKEGLKNVFKRHEQLAHITRRAIKSIGLELFSQESPSNAVTAILAPEGIDGQKIYKTLKDKYGITTAGGQGKAKGKIFRIAHLGYADIFDIIIAVSGIEMVLAELDFPIKLGRGVSTIEKLILTKQNSRHDVV